MKIQINPVKISISRLANFGKKKEKYKIRNGDGDEDV